MKKLSKPKSMYTNAWHRWWQQQASIQHKEHNDGSSQVMEARSWSVYSGSQEVIAEAIYLEVLHKVFSDQPGKQEVSRHIANVLAPMTYHWGEDCAVKYYDWMKKDGARWEVVYHAAKLKHQRFWPKYEDLWAKARANIENRVEAQRARLAADRKEREAKAAPLRAERRANARVRPLSTVQTPDPEVTDG